MTEPTVEIKAKDNSKESLDNLKRRLQHFEAYCKDQDDRYGAEVLYHARERIERLEQDYGLLWDMAQQMLGRIAEGKKISVGSINNMVESRFYKESVERWQAVLEELEMDK